jgi:ribosomal peptide maturation radical SAM protein 1
METHRFKHLCGGADALIIVPPFAGTERPSLGVHTLQACCARRGLCVKVVYANLDMAAEIGEDVFREFWHTSQAMFGERFFSTAAFGRPLDEDWFQILKLHLIQTDSAAPWMGAQTSWQGLDRLEKFWKKVSAWVDEFVSDLLRYPCPVIGCTTSFEQTAASLAFLNSVKKQHPKITTILGGANCEGEMALGLYSLGDSIDYIFSGESEETFPSFLCSVVQGKKPPAGVIRSEPCQNLDAVPPPKYTEYYEQYRFYLPDSREAVDKQMFLPYETSRGCVWGQKRKCTFCGLNGENARYRVKSESKVLAELRQLLQEHPTRRVAMTDNSFPPSYLKSFVLQLAESLPHLSIVYEIRSSFTLEQMFLLRRAGITELQPGLEALSTSLLRRMNKGLTARQNVMFLRAARALQIRCAWNLLLAFPGDTEAEYVDTLNVIKAIFHLAPPNIISPMSIERFSEYYRSPEKYGIHNLRPAKAYFLWLPDHADISRLAYHFEGDFQHFARPDREIIKQIFHTVGKWQGEWRKESPAKCELVRASHDQFLLVDTRGLAPGSSVLVLSESQARAALIDRPKVLEQRQKDGFRENDTQWAIERRLILDLDGWYTSVVIADPELIMALSIEQSAEEMT